MRIRDKFHASVDLDLDQFFSHCGKRNTHTNTCTHTHKDSHICADFRQGLLWLRFILIMYLIPGACDQNRSCVQISVFKFTLHEEHVTWFQARDSCRSSGGDLAVFSDLDKKMYIKAFKSLMGNYWIGMTQAEWKSGL